VTDAPAVFLGSAPPRRLELVEPPLGEGGQASVFALEGTTDTVVKLYHDEPSPEDERRLEGMLVLHHPDQFLSEDGTGHPVLAWPAELVRDGDDHVIGYTMRRVGAPEYVPLGTLFTPAQRRECFGGVSWRFLAGIAFNLAAVVDGLHGRGLALGDLSPTNVVVNQDGYLCFLDCDSIQFTHPVTGELFPCTYFTAHYAAPELQRDEHVPRTQQSDDFALAIVLCQLLLVGDHPFMGVPRDAHEDDDADIGANIRAGLSYVVHPDRVDTPPATYPVRILPPAVHTLAGLAFGPGHDDPSARPSSAQWMVALNETLAAIATCPMNALHTYSDHLSGCPWCARTEEGFRDPFPDSSASATPQSTTSTGFSPGAPSPAGGSWSLARVIIVLVIALIVAGVILAIVLNGGDDYSSY
jgi:DNA-binding helix-hairpin-helix protein with protein kinase domain